MCLDEAVGTEGQTDAVQHTGGGRQVKLLVCGTQEAVGTEGQTAGEQHKGGGRHQRSDRW